MAPYRILMLGAIPLASPWNGADKNLARTIVEFDTENYYTVQTGQDDQWPEERVRAIRLPTAGRMPTTGQKARAFFFMMRYGAEADLVHIVASLAHPSFWTKLAIRAWSAGAHTPLIHTVPSVGDAPVSRQHFPGDMTVVLSEYTRRLLEEKGIGHVVRVYPALDLERLRPVATSPALAAKLALGPRAVLYPAHYGPDSGIREMIQAFSRLPDELRDSVLVLACRAHAWQDAAREAEQALAWARELGIGDRVRIVGESAQMPALIAGCALTALVPSRPAGKMDLPMVILETLAQGHPVLVSDRPPLSESLLGDGGMAVDPGDIVQLSAALTKLLGNDHLRHRLGAQGRAAVVTQCDPTRLARRYQEIYDMVITARETTLAPSCGTSVEVRE